MSIIIIAHNYAQVLAGLRPGQRAPARRITFDKPTAQTSVAELTDLVVAEYRNRRTARRPEGA